MKIRALLSIIALVGAVACGGGETKKDEPATESSTGAVESESDSEPEEAPAETAPLDEEPAPEEDDGVEEGGE